MYKIKDLTPKEHRCIIGACPTIVETDNNSYIIIGDIVDPKTLEKLNLSKKIGSNEIAIEIPTGLLSDLQK